MIAMTSQLYWHPKTKTQGTTLDFNNIYLGENLPNENS